MNNNSQHTFHIPVMGLAYTIDSPVKVARFGIDSVISIIEDNLIEKMRKYYYEHINETYTPITEKEHDHRAKRITDYLNLVQRIVNEQMDKLRSAAFDLGSDIVKYFELLPEDSYLKQMYHSMQNLSDTKEIEEIQSFLRRHIVRGQIDVNIMTKVDKNNPDLEETMPGESSDALAALRGYANSDLTGSSVVFSAGLNPRLYNYLGNLRAFDARGHGQFDKKVVIKVSDYRSALIQGKYLAKKGIWVSEFRVESGLNCGGHAFASDGYLLGPILEEFKQKKEELISSLHALYVSALQERGAEIYEEPHPIYITVQGGIGTHEEDKLMREYYEVHKTGWGTPFLLVPEATTTESETLELLSNAGEEDVCLSHNSPLGVRFHYLKGTSSEIEKQTRLAEGKPGSPCTERFLVSNTEFTEVPICTASRKYQRLKIDQLNGENLDPETYEKRLASITTKECLCIGLSNAAFKNYGLKPIKNQTAVTICPGPNIAYFKGTFTLKEMVDHIYGRIKITDDSKRPHMFVKELSLYIDYLREQLEEMSDNMDAKQEKYIKTFTTNLKEGIAYYKLMAERVKQDYQGIKDKIWNALEDAESEIESMVPAKVYV
ncbi:MAG: hypothetical protein JJU28_23830 [Cyclobacteriaceae bacterium]|nr:hypothetical protein [Cyclobacteriaceae bacterium]